MIAVVPLELMAMTRRENGELSQQETPPSIAP
jgi:hypothetical protein